jgi:hypothetical protein
MSGIGGDGTDESLIADLLAHHEQVDEGSRSVQGRDSRVTDSLYINGFDPADGSALDIREHDLASWTDHRGILIEKVAITRVAANSEPGTGTPGTSHLRLDIG